MSTLRRDNVFVVGCQRSGTSAIWAGLTAHPDLKPIHGFDAETGFDPKELYYFRNIFAGRQQFSSPMYGWPVDELYLKKIVDATIEHCIEHHGSRSGRFVNAHPGDGLFIEDILATMPEARIVCVLRHPEEVIWSAAHAPWVARGRHLDRKALVQHAMHWRQHCIVAEKIREGLYGDSVLIVRHEDLIEDPAETARRLAEHVSVPVDSTMADQLGAPTFNSSFRNQEDPKILVMESRRAISRAKRFRQIIVDTIGCEMEAIGYSDLGNPPLIARPARKSSWHFGVTRD